MRLSPGDTTTCVLIALPGLMGSTTPTTKGFTMPEYYSQIGEAIGAAMRHNADMAARFLAEEQEREGRNPEEKDSEDSGQESQSV